MSWAKPHKTATTGNFAVKVFGEEGYTAYRKVVEPTMVILNENLIGKKLSPYYGYDSAACRLESHYQ